MHRVPHLTVFDGQVSAQLPATQSSPSPQLVPALAAVQSPDAPQKARSVSGSMQRPAQSTVPEVQESAQTPWVHRKPLAQAVPAFPTAQSPEAPQKASSV